MRLFFVFVCFIHEVRPNPDSLLYKNLHRTPTPYPYPLILPLNPSPMKWDENPSRPSYSTSLVVVDGVMIFIHFFLLRKYLSLEFYCIV